MALYLLESHLGYPGWMAHDIVGNYTARAASVADAVSLIGQRCDLFLYVGELLAPEDVAAVIPMFRGDDSIPAEVGLTRWTVCETRTGMSGILACDTDTHWAFRGLAERGVEGNETAVLSYVRPNRPLHLPLPKALLELASLVFFPQYDDPFEVAMLQPRFRVSSES